MHATSHFEPSRLSRVTLELLDTIPTTVTSTISGMANDLRGVEPFLANVIERVVEETRQLAEGLGLEVVLLV